MRSGRDPTRRNRKLGTPDFAWRDRGEGMPPFEIPWPRWEQRSPGERWTPQRVEEHTVHGRTLQIVVERPLSGWVHACAPEDVVEVLGRLPAPDTEGLGLVVLLQPRRKEDALRPVWGRLHWTTRFRGYAGPAVTLSAYDLRRPVLRWSRSLWPEGQDELDRLRAVGFAITEGRREYGIHLEPATVRRWHRERTLPHEVGHWIDFRRRVIEPTGTRDAAEAETHPDYPALIERWRSRPWRERERFADAYADAHQAAAIRARAASDAAARQT
jgi:hypothetical protein